MVRAAPPSPPVIDTLAAADVFHVLEPPQLAALATTCLVRRFGRGELVFLRGDPGDCMFVLATGSVEVSVASLEGKDVLLAVLGPAQTFGELAVVDGGPRVATVRARGESVVVVVPRAAVTVLLDRYPRVARAFLTALSAMVRRVDEQVCDASLLDLPHRVAKLLAGAAPTTVVKGIEQPNDGFVPVDLHLTQTELARQVGGSRQQVNRILMALEADGAIRRTGHRLTAVRLDRLVDTV